MNKFFHLFSLVALITLTGFSNPVKTGTFIIEFKDIAPARGMVEASIYNDEDKFLVKDQFIQKKRAEIIDGNARIVFKNIPFGKVAIGSYHDINSDKNYDKTFIGLPKEPYAFSKKPTCNWRKPNFEEVAINFRQEGQVLQMKFQKFMD